MIMHTLFTTTSLLGDNSLLTAYFMNHANTGMPAVSVMFLKALLIFWPAPLVAVEEEARALVELAILLVLLLGLLELSAATMMPPCTFAGALLVLVSSAADL